MTYWAIQTDKRAKKIKEGTKDRESKQDKILKYCLNCEHVFQTPLFTDNLYKKVGNIVVYEDFPSIGKERVESCPSCEL